jgi:hypothetical protein
MKVGPTMIRALGIAAAAVTGYWQNVARPILTKLSEAFASIGRVFRGVYNASLGPVFMLIVKGIALMASVWGAMLGALSHVPGIGHWAKTASDALKDAADKANGLADSVGHIPNKVKISVTSNIPALTAQAERMNAALKGKGVQSHYSTGYGGGLTAATGTNYSKQGTYLVGELGPELVYLPGGSKVKTAAETNQLLGSPTSGGPSISRIHPADHRPTRPHVANIMGISTEIAIDGAFAHGEQIADMGPYS